MRRTISLEEKVRVPFGPLLGILGFCDVRVRKNGILVPLGA
jgi:hypothetical protein